MSIFLHFLEHAIDHALSTQNRRYPEDPDYELANFDYEIKISICECGPDKPGQIATLCSDITIPRRFDNNLMGSLTQEFPNRAATIEMLETLLEKIKQKD